MNREEKLKQELEKLFDNCFSTQLAVDYSLKALQDPSILMHADPLVMEQAGWEPKKQWFSVEDITPDSHRTVYINIDGVGVCNGYFDIFSRKWNHFYGAAKVTHWMEIIKPQPPKP